jgi:hypothetical protein
MVTLLKTTATVSSVGPHRHRTCLLGGGATAASTLAIPSFFAIPSFAARARGSIAYLAPSM